MATTTKRMLHRLLYFALIDLRLEGHEHSDKLVFLLADLFHNIPLQLERVDRGETSPEEIMQWLQTRAQKNGLGEWLELRTEEASQY